jgi:integrase
MNVQSFMYHSPNETEDNFLTANPTNTIVSQGGIFMGNLWGKVVWRKDRKHWCVRGKWQSKRISFSEYETALGKQTCQSEAEATQLQIIISNEIAHGHFNPERYRKGKQLHLEAYSKRWLADVEADLASGSWHVYDWAMRKYIHPILGTRFLDDLARPDLKELMKGVQHLRPKSRKNVLDTLHVMMQSAKDDGHITQLPTWVEFKGQNKVVKPAIKYLTPEIQIKILEAMPERHRPIFLFMMATGCRPGEAKEFRKIDVYQPQRYVIFEKAVGYKGETKNVKAEKPAPFPITPELSEVLKSAPRDIIGPLVFPNPDTGRRYSKQLNEIWNLACENAGIKRFALYASVRHSYACQLLNDGVNKSTISRLLRHSDPRMVERYAEYEVATLEKDAGRVTRLKKVK